MKKRPTNITIPDLKLLDLDNPDTFIDHTDYSVEYPESSDVEADDEGKETKMTKQELTKLITDGEFTLTDVIDVIVDINGIIGVGLFSLGEELNEYVRGLHKRSGNVPY